MKLAAHGSGASSFESKIDLTPLIDCIFQLILFLVLTSQITVQAEEVALPFALEGKPEDEIRGGDRAPLLINVVLDPRKPDRQGQIVFNGQLLGNDQAKLKALLQKEVIWDAEPPPLGLDRGYEPGPGNISLSKLTVLVRADKDVRAEYIRTIFMACQEVGIYRVRVSSTTPQP